MVTAALAAFLAFAAAVPAAGTSAARGGQRLRRLRRGLFAAPSGQQLIQGQALSGLHPYYHTTEEISSELQRLAKSCPSLTLHSVSGNSTEGRAAPAIDVVTIRVPGSRPVNKNFILFGEHSRELISPESGLHLARTLCGETSLAQRAQEVLRDSEFQIVVNGNPESRRKVEGGDFCLRTNPEGVDLNRNWDEGWKATADFAVDDTNPGPRPFSEPETQAFRQLVEAYRPTTFLTVHSGTKGLYMPWAFDMEHLAQRNQPQMMRVLKALDGAHCECPFGAAGKEVGYSCPGTCLDWVYDHLQTPYAFAFEIYVGGDDSEHLRARWQKALASGGRFYQEHSHLGHAHFKDLYQSHPSGFVQVEAQRRRSVGTGSDSAEACFAMFNPGNATEYQAVVENWSAAYLDMAAMIAASLQSGHHNGSEALPVGGY